MRRVIQAHLLLKSYRDSPHSWKVECKCGWREAAMTQEEAEQRHRVHAKGGW